MSTQFTPWSCEVHELSEGYSAIVYDSRGHGIVDHLDAPTANLIAAAPELYEALEWILRIAETNFEQDEKLRSQGARTLKRIADKAEAVLAKARGDLAEVVGGRK